MKLTTVFREAWRAYRQHFGALMLTLLLELVLRAIALTPLLFMVLPETKALALLCVPLYLLIVFPARQNVALAVQDMLDGGSVFSLRLISGEDYGRKLLRALTSALRLVMWFVPLIAGVIVALWATRGSMDGFTLLRSIRSIGGGDSFRGLAIVAAVYLLTLVPPVLGCAFHSGARHARALGDPSLTKGRHGKLIGLWLLSLAVFVPFVAAAAIPCAGYVRSLADAVTAFMNTASLSIPSFGSTRIAVLALFVVLALPAIPLRTLLPAVYMRAVKAEKEGVAGAVNDAA